jgi:hypothetical protein
MDRRRQLRLLHRENLRKIRADQGFFELERDRTQDTQAGGYFRNEGFAPHVALLVRCKCKPNGRSFIKILLEVRLLESCSVFENQGPAVVQLDFGCFFPHGVAVRLVR